MIETRFTLSELIDFETQLARDAERSYAELEERDRTLGSRLGNSTSSARTQLKGWLELLRNETTEVWPGAPWQNYLSLLNWGLGLSGLIMAIVSVRALLAYDGSSPVNIVPFLSLYVLLQLLLLFLFFSKSALMKLFRPHVPPFSWLGLRLMRWLEQRVLHRMPLRSGTSVRTLELSLHRFHRLHNDLLYILSLRTTQIFGLSFFIGSLLTLVYLISIHDYAFAWSTTLKIDAAGFHRWISIIAWPFAWIDPSLVPSQTVIEGTNYVRLEGRYLGSAIGQRASDLELTRAWWPFLSLCIASYGILPRLALFLWADYASRRYLKRWPYSDQASNALRQRLLGAAHAWKTGESIAELLAPIPPPSTSPINYAGGARCILVRWFDPPYSFEAIKIFLTRAHPWTIDAEIDSRGTEKASSEVLKALAQPLKANEARVVITIHDPWELPGEAFTSFIKALRRTEGRDFQVYCAPVHAQSEQLIGPADPATLKLWRQALGALRDPYVGLLFDQGEYR